MNRPIRSADLIGAVVTALRPNVRLATLEGDATFTFMRAEKVEMLLDTIEPCYFDACRANPPGADRS
jgi:hypothetical protein